MTKFVVQTVTFAMLIGIAYCRKLNMPLMAALKSDTLRKGRASTIRRFCRISQVRALSGA